jgi:Ser/Thr protein kinase RdoA (MazF antagonist)
MPLPRPGAFGDADLRVEPWPVADLVGLVEAERAGSALAAWPPSSYDGLLAVARDAQTLLDGVRRTCLVHSDLNPKNLLVDPGTLEVTGLVDWEFAHAGWPGTDLGNLLRFERDEPFAASVLDAYRAHVPDAGPEVLDQARAADLAALVELAARRGQNPVTEQAHDLLLAVARSGDLHAVP